MTYMKHVTCMSIIRLPSKRGLCTLVRVEKGYKMEIENAVTPVMLTESQGQILKNLDETRDGLIAAELARKLGMTHAGILYLLKPLLERGIVERVPLKGGGVLYYSNFDIKEERLSAMLEEFRKRMEEKIGKPIEKISLEELAREIQDLPESDRRVFTNWVLDGGWKGK